MHICICDNSTTSPIHSGVLDMFNVVFFADRVVGDYYLANEKQTPPSKESKGKASVAAEQLKEE